MCVEREREREFRVLVAELQGFRLRGCFFLGATSMMVVHFWWGGTLQVRSKSSVLQASSLSLALISDGQDGSCCSIPDTDGFTQELRD